LFLLLWGSYARLTWLANNVVRIFRAIAGQDVWNSCRRGHCQPTDTFKQIRQIADSVARFGFCNPILIDDADRIIAGHGRVQAAKVLGLTAVPALRLSHLSDAEKRAYVLADNRLAELAGWDKEILAIELQGLIDLDFEVELTGFEMARSTSS